MFLKMLDNLKCVKSSADPVKNGQVPIEPSEVLLQYSGLDDSLAMSLWFFDGYFWSIWNSHFKLCTYNKTFNTLTSVFQIHVIQMFKKNCTYTIYSLGVPLVA